MGDKRKHRIRFRRMQIAFAAFLALGFVLIAQRGNVRYQSLESSLKLLDPDVFAAASSESEAEETAGQREADSLLIYHKGSETSSYIREEFIEVLGEMKISWDELDLSTDREIPLEDYDKISIALSDLSLLGEAVFSVMEWVEEGGSLLFLYPMENNGSLQVIYADLGIRENSYDYMVVETLRFADEVMIGGTQKEYTITDPFPSSMTVILEDDCKVYITTGGEREMPIFWEREHGEERLS